MTQWTIERLGRKGDGVALSGDARALAPLVLPGEVVEGEALDGRIAAPRIVTPSPDRIRPVCGHYRACGGCSLMHATDAFTTAWKTQVVLTALAAQGIAAPLPQVHVSAPNSRRRAVLSGRRTKKGATVGFHGRASDVIVDLTECHVLRPQILAALPLLRRIVIAGASRAAELSLVVIHGPAGLDVAVRGGKPMDPALFQALAALADEGDLARLDWDGQAITRRAPALPMGRAHVVPPPGAFLQATAQGEAALLAAVRDTVAGASKVADLFAGCGTFTLPLAEQAAVHAVEGLAAPLSALDSAWRATSGLNRVTTEVRDLARRPLMLDELGRFDAIVIDPPRAGAEAQMRQIAAARVPVVAAVSCDPVSFAKDARILADAGYGIDRLWVVDQFRFSPHVELVAALTHR
ncbi:23S rRNA (uracil(1939)-C(5))-methyltransferase RlmD [Paracoccus marcusii]|uniref:class I SAM-dependent RNA methyltransferase n=1 Tax=Paracoccus marcusii TaxID=59779 RepID=UPI001C3DC6B9|nr:class I SAM-dependent RNA methyltransferase [Paracoccus marcusii]QXI64919.1 23S rRNA (uracil(1939)-C(5))-methyltransferase RlmD [Paracoccus marcusii]